MALAPGTLGDEDVSAAAPRSESTVALARISVRASDEPATAASPSPYVARGLTTAASPGVERGLWGYDGLAVAPSKLGIIIKVLCVMFGYAVSLLINGAASRLLPPRFATPPPTAGVDPLGGLGFVVRVCDPMFLLAALRMLASSGLMGVMVLRGDVPWGGGAALGNGGAPWGVPLVTDGRALAAPFVMGFTNALGYALYLSLTARGGVAIWSALVGMYVVVPCSYGIVAKGEARSPRKLAGIALACAAGVMLVWSDEAEETDSGVPPAQNVLLFLACIVTWGVCDSLAGYVARTLHTFVVVGASGLGYGAFALVTAAVAFGAVAAAPAAAVAPPPPSVQGVSAGAAYALMALSQALGVGAMYASVLLGKTSEASSFLPITSLYTAITALLAVVVLGDVLAPLAWAGIVVGAVAMLLIATGGVAAGGDSASVGGPVPRDDAIEDDEDGDAVVVKGSPSSP